MIASDGRVNERSDTADVSVRISRDEQPPRFIDEPFMFTVSENTPVNSTFDTISATDPDLQVCEPSSLLVITDHDL